MIHRTALPALLVFATGLPLLSPHAQERTAAAPLSQEMTWNTLQNQNNATLKQANVAQIATNAAKTKLDKMEACAKIGKLYAPGITGADPVTGCRSNITLTGCYERSGGAGAHVSCGASEIITKVCTAGRDPDCINSRGQRLYTVITCCKINSGS